MRELLFRHYDPGYAASIRRNFSRYETAPLIAPRDRSVAAMEETAAQLVRAA